MTEDIVNNSHFWALQIEQNSLKRNLWIYPGIGITLVWLLGENGGVSASLHPYERLKTDHDPPQKKCLHNHFHLSKSLQFNLNIIYQRFQLNQCTAIIWIPCCICQGLASFVHPAIFPEAPMWEWEPLLAILPTKGSCVFLALRAIACSKGQCKNCKVTTA